MLRPLGYIALALVGLAAVLAAVSLISGAFVTQTASTQAPVAAGPAPAAGEGAAAPAASAPPQANWTTRCASTGRAEALDCSVEQRLVLTQSRQLLAAVVIRVPHDTRTPAMMIQVPLGLSLSEGVDLAFDKAAPQRFPIQTCDNSGCYAGTPVNDAMLQSLLTAQNLTVTFRGLDKKPIEVPMGLTGFVEAYARVK